MSLFVEDLDKHAKKYIADDVRRELVLSEIKEYNAVVEGHKKRNKGFVKEFEAMIVDPLITPESFAVFFEGVLLARVELQAEYASMRVDIAKSITDEEWDQIREVSRKAYQKKLKETDKEMTKLDAQLDKVELAIMKHYQHPDAKAAASQIYSEFKNQVKELAQQKADFDVSAEPDLVNREVDPEGLIMIIAASNAIRLETFQAFINTYFGLREIADQDDWPAIAKEFMKF